MDNPVIQATLGTRHTTEKSKGANPEWTIRWYRQHWVQDTQQRKVKGQTQNGQSGDTGNIGYKTHNRENQRGKPRMDNPVIQATLGTRHTTEKSKGANPEWTIRWYRQHWVQDTQQRKAKGQTQNGQSGDTGNIGYKTHNREKQRGKPRMDKLVIQATLGTRHATEKNKGANPEWTIRWYRQHWVQDIQQRKAKGQTQNGQSGDTGNIGYKTHNREKQRGNPEWTIWWYRPHWVQDTQQRKPKGQTQNGQSGDTGNIEYKTHSRESQRDKPRMDNLVIQATLGTRHTTEKTKGANPEWTIRWYRQHWVQDTQQRKQRGKTRMDNLVIQATLGTRHTTEKTKGANPEWTIWWYRQHWVQDTQQRKAKGQTQNGQSGDTGNIGYKTYNREKQRGKPRMDNPVIQATLGTRHTTEKSKGANPEWTIWWYRQHWVQDTQQRKAKGQTQNGQSGDTGNIGYKTHNREKQRGKPRMDNPVIQATLGTRHTTEKNKGANPEWTIWWYRQHWVQDTQQRKIKGQTHNGQSGDTGNIGYKTHNRENQRGKPRMDNLVIQATLGKRHTTEKTKGANPEWTIRWYRQH